MLSIKRNSPLLRYGVADPVDGVALEPVWDLVGEARQAIYDLRPTVLEDGGLAAVLRLLVRDEGHSLVHNGKAKRIGRGEKVGLSGMRERVSLLDGRFGLHSEPGRGTSVEDEVELPDTDHDG